MANLISLTWGIGPVVNVNVSAYYNAVKPDIGPEWQLRVQAAVLLPTSILSRGVAD